MTLTAMLRWRRVLFLIGSLFGVSGALLYGLERTTRDYYAMLQQAE
jgi:hypothetical protein